MTDNIRGVFPIDICGAVRDTKCNIGVAVKLEREIFGMAITKKLTNIVVNEDISIFDITHTIKVALEANGDSRLSFEEIGNDVILQGVDKFSEWYITFLTYAITGKTVADFEEQEAQEIGDTKKK